MSDDESTKAQVLDMYVDRLRAGNKAQNSLTKIGKEMQISRETLRGWKRDGHWIFERKWRSLKICKTRINADFAKAARPADTRKRSRDGTLGI